MQYAPKRTITLSACYSAIPMSAAIPLLSVKFCIVRCVLVDDLICKDIVAYFDLPLVYVFCFSAFLFFCQIQSRFMTGNSQSCLHFSVVNKQRHAVQHCCSDAAVAMSFARERC